MFQITEVAVSGTLIHRQVLRHTFATETEAFTRANFFVSAVERLHERVKARRDGM